eukprot:Rhum_TRINITY_DN9072_c0_g2::Rhum_TRINITY_DN9072_c0_g2_i1::g.31446::m.31446
MECSTFQRRDEANPLLFCVFFCIVSVLLQRCIIQIYRIVILFFSIISLALLFCFCFVLRWRVLIALSLGTKTRVRGGKERKERKLEVLQQRAPHTPCALQTRVGGARRASGAPGLLELRPRHQPLLGLLGGLLRALLLRGLLGGLLLRRLLLGLLRRLHRALALDRNLADSRGQDELAAVGELDDHVREGGLVAQGLEEGTEVVLLGEGVEVTVVLAANRHEHVAGLQAALVRRLAFLAADDGGTLVARRVRQLDADLRELDHLLLRHRTLLRRRRRTGRLPRPLAVPLLHEAHLDVAQAGDLGVQVPQVRVDHLDRHRQRLAAGLDGHLRVAALVADGHARDPHALRPRLLHGLSHTQHVVHRGDHGRLRALRDDEGRRALGDGVLREGGENPRVLRVVGLLRLLTLLLGDLDGLAHDAALEHHLHAHLLAHRRRLGHGEVRVVLAVERGARQRVDLVAARLHDLAHGVDAEGGRRRALREVSVGVPRLDGDVDALARLRVARRRQRHRRCVRGVRVRRARLHRRVVHRLARVRDLDAAAAQPLRDEGAAPALVVDLLHGGDLVHAVEAGHLEQHLLAVLDRRRLVVRATRADHGRDNLAGRDRVGGAGDDRLRQVDVPQERRSLQPHERGGGGGGSRGKGEGRSDAGVGERVRLRQLKGRRVRRRLAHAAGPAADDVAPHRLVLAAEEGRERDVLGQVGSAHDGAVRGAVAHNGHELNLVAGTGRGRCRGERHLDVGGLLPPRELCEELVLRRRLVLREVVALADGGAALRLLLRVVHEEPAVQRLAAELHLHGLVPGLGGEVGEHEGGALRLLHLLVNCGGVLRHLRAALRLAGHEDGELLRRRGLDRDTLAVAGRDEDVHGLALDDGVRLRGDLQEGARGVREAPRGDALAGVGGDGGQEVVVDAAQVADALLQVVVAGALAVLQVLLAGELVAHDLLRAVDELVLVLVVVQEVLDRLLGELRVDGELLRLQLDLLELGLGVAHLQQQLLLSKRRTVLRLVDSQLKLLVRRLDVLGSPRVLVRPLAQLSLLLVLGAQLRLLLAHVALERLHLLRLLADDLLRLVALLTRLRHHVLELRHVAQKLGDALLLLLDLRQARLDDVVAVRHVLRARAQLLALLPQLLDELVVVLLLLLHLLQVHRRHLLEVLAAAHTLLRLPVLDGRAVLDDETLLALDFVGLRVVLGEEDLVCVAEAVDDVLQRLLVLRLRVHIVGRGEDVQVRSPASQHFTSSAHLVEQIGRAVDLFCGAVCILFFG